MTFSLWTNVCNHFHLEFIAFQGLNIEMKDLRKNECLSKVLIKIMKCVKSKMKMHGIHQHFQDAKRCGGM